MREAEEESEGESRRGLLPTPSPPPTSKSSPERLESWEALPGLPRLLSVPSREVPSAKYVSELPEDMVPVYSRKKYYLDCHHTDLMKLEV